MVRERKITVESGSMHLTDEVEIFYEVTVTPFGTSDKLGVQKKYTDRRVYVTILKRRRGDGNTSINPNGLRILSQSGDYEKQLHNWRPVTCKCSFCGPST